jgi:fructoselysine-6-P-deglycase FrlB-like protein
VAVNDFLNDLVRQAKTSELFTAPRIEQDLRGFLEEQANAIDDLALRMAGGEFEDVWFVGAGGSWASMYSGKYLLDRLTAVSAEVALSYELTWRAPRRLGPRSLVFLASYSGGTEDTLAALRHARATGATTVAITRRRPNPMALEATHVVDYDSTELYILPLAAVMRFALRVAIEQGEEVATQAEAALASMDLVPRLIGDAYRSAESEALLQAREFLSSTGLYVIAAGPLYGLAYKFALTVFMENVRVHGSPIESAELRHGPIEMFERQRPDMVFLLGTDESRGLTERGLALSQKHGARTLVFDAADYDGLHPLLTPFVLLVPLQWFTVYSALLRGITDLDDRVFLGRVILALGEDSTWP